MTPQAAYTGPDPLDWARKQLDFEAVAKQGPTMREVLFKAQTIVPISRPKLQSKPLTAAAAVLLVLAALLAPWLPDRTVLLTAHVVLDRQYARSQAQEIAFETAKRLPDHILLGAEFSPGDNTTEDPSGALRLSFTAMDTSNGKLESDAVWAMKTPLKEDPVKLQRPTRLQSSARSSPVAAVWRRISGLATKRSSTGRPGEEFANNLLENQQLLLDGLRDVLEREGFLISAAGYLDLGGTGSGSTYDLTLDSWPSPLGISLDGYNALSEEERSYARATAQDYINRLNLNSTPLAFTSAPQPWLPVLIEVRTQSGLPDRFLTDRLQARLKQPTVEELSRQGFDIVQLVDTAVKDMLPGEEVRIDYQAIRDGQPANRGELYRVTVSLSGKKTVNLRELAGEDEVADEESIDW